MQRPSFDPGLTQQFTSPLRRIINKDGTFNVHRRGTTWRDFHPYLHLINMSWPKFMACLISAYAVANLIFASVYFALGPSELEGIKAHSEVERFFDEFFFSAHTLTTVGYGNISPKGMEANAVASIEALTGVLGFAPATGLVLGRFSRPWGVLGFGKTLLITNDQENPTFHSRVFNRRKNDLMDIEARVMLTIVE